MHGMILASSGEVFAGVLGASMALLIIGGGILLAWQRTRLRYALMQAAIERGIPTLPGVPPIWLNSMRQGVTTLVLGLALAAIGTGVYERVKDVPMPASFVAATQPGALAMQDNRMPPPPRDGDGPDNFGGMRERRPHEPPRPDPALERWHRAEDQKAVAMIAMGGGKILAILGLVRIGFSFAEKRYTRQGGGSV